jgi:PKD repeat protein
MTTSRTKNQYITVLNIPRADFTSDKNRGGAPLNVNFIDQSTGLPTSWKWDFRDGGTSTEKNPVHPYTIPGSFTVTLGVSNANGQDSVSKADFIVTTLAPVADFKADRQLGKAPFVVRFTDLSKGSPTAWAWDFGDGTGSDEQHPSHIYMSEGSYNVKLTVSNQHGSDSIFMTGDSQASPQVTTEQAGTAAAETSLVTLAGTAGITSNPDPATTRTPLPPFIVVPALVAGLILAAAGKRK